MSNYQLHVVCYRNVCKKRLESLNPQCYEELETKETWIGMSTTPIIKFFLTDTPENLKKSGGHKQDEFREEKYKSCFTKCHPEAFACGEKEEMQELAREIHEESFITEEKEGEKRYIFDVVWSIEPSRPIWKKSHINPSE